MKPVATACPDLESIAAYLDGQLTDRERARITEHLSSCEDCYSLFTESAQTHVTQKERTTSEQRSWREWFVGPRLAWSSAGVAVAVAATVLLLVAPGRLLLSLQPTRELQALVAAVGTDRPIEARLASGFAYGPLRGPVRAGRPVSPAVSPDVRIAAAHIEKSLAGLFLSYLCQPRWPANWKNRGPSPCWNI